MTWLYRFTAAGRYVGKVLIDRPMEQYAHRTDLTEIEPPPAVGTSWPFFSAGAWALVPTPQD
jgi:hypothetical protein